MIGYLRGRLLAKEPNEAIVDAGGVGYRLTIPVSTFYELGEVGGEARLHVLTLVRDDSIALYGFISRGEKDLFQRLIAISNVGPKTALAILSGMGPADLLEAVESEEYHRIAQTPGIGRKTAERLVLELRDKLPELRAELEVEAPARSAAGALKADVVSALINLGYRRREVDKAADWALKHRGDEDDFGSVFKAALARLTGL